MTWLECKVETKKVLSYHILKRGSGAQDLMKSRRIRPTTPSQPPTPHKHLHNMTEGGEEEVTGLVGNVVFMEKGISPALKSRSQGGILSEIVE